MTAAVRKTVSECTRCIECTEPIPDGTNRLMSVDEAVAWAMRPELVVADRFPVESGQPYLEEEVGDVLVFFTLFATLWSGTKKAYDSTIRVFNKTCGVGR